MAGGRQRDTLYAAPLDAMVDFRFDEAVADVFPDMIQRSVPGYASVIALTGLLAASSVRDTDRIYDLGCSLGASSLAMQQRLAGRDVHIIAVDKAMAMLACFQKHLRQHPRTDDQPTIELVCADLRDVKPVQAGFIVMNYTLQFVPPAERRGLLHRLFESLRPGGALLLSEKVCFDEIDDDLWFSERHADFKRANGYSELEISQKRAALENVLLPETAATHEARLKTAGFSKVRRVMQNLNFFTWVAEK